MIPIYRLFTLETADGTLMEFIKAEREGFEIVTEVVKANRYLVQNGVVKIVGEEE